MNPPTPILHLATVEDWGARTASHYEPAAFASEGFIHCCTAAQLSGVVERYYRGRSDLVLLSLNAPFLEADLVWEDTSGSGENFPHIYGPINVDAVSSADSFDATGAERSGRSTG